VILAALAFLLPVVRALDHRLELEHDRELESSAQVNLAPVSPLDSTTSQP
jgi:hypothetical protein